MASLISISRDCDPRPCCGFVDTVASDGHVLDETANVGIGEQDLACHSPGLEVDLETETLH